jgi:ethanolamine utilization protein
LNGGIPLNFEKLIGEIVRRVEYAILKFESGKENKPKILVISKDLNEGTSEIKNNQKLNSCFNVDGFDMSGQQVDLESYNKVVIADLDNESLSKLTLGIFDNPYLKLIGSCIMQGKDISIVEDDIEFLKYRDTAPKSFLQMFEHKLNTLKDWGMDVRSLDDLVVTLCANPDKLCSASVGGGADNAVKRQEISESRTEDKTETNDNSGDVFMRRVLSETDVIGAKMDSRKEIRISSRTIVTEVAKECAHKNGIKITVVA